MLALIARLVRQNRSRHIGVLLCGVGVSIVAGAIAFAATQHVSIGTGLYWAVTTATTVGYGDVLPHNAVGRVIAVAVMLTAIPLLGAAFALATGSAAAAGLRRFLAMDDLFPKADHRLVVGAHPSVPAILEELLAVGESVVWLAEVDQAAAPGDVYLVHGSPTAQSAIRAARPQLASQALVACETDGDVLVSVVLLRAEAPDLEITALVRSASVRDALHDLGVEQVVSLDELLAHTLAKSLEAPHSGEMFRQLLDSDEHRLVEAAADSDACGKSLSTVRGERAGLILGLVRDNKFTLGIADDPEVATGDRLLVVETNTAPSTG
jgi:voltage-gated potassium channel